MKKNKTALILGCIGLFFLLLQALFVLIEPAHTFFEQTKNFFSADYAVYAYTAYDQIRLLLLGAALLFFFAGWVSSLSTMKPAKTWSWRLGLAFVIISVFFAVITAVVFADYIKTLEQIESVRAQTGVFEVDMPGLYRIPLGTGPLISVCTGIAVGGMLLAWLTQLLREHLEAPKTLRTALTVLFSALLFAIGSEFILVFVNILNIPLCIVPAVIFLSLGAILFAIYIFLKIKTHTDKYLLLYEIAILFAMLYAVFLIAGIHAYSSLFYNEYL